jgi:hypothetical protein
MPTIEALLEGERRGILNERNAALLAEARKRGRVPQLAQQGLKVVPEGAPGEPLIAPIEPRIPEVTTPALQEAQERVGRAGQVRTGLETLGLLGGGALGGGPTPTGVAGAGLGFAAGAQAADIFEALTGVRQLGTVGEEIAEIPREVATGAALEAGGQVAGRLVQRALTRPPTEIAIARREGILTENLSPRAQELAARRARIKAFDDVGATPTRQEIVPKNTLAQRREIEIANAEGRIADDLKVFEDTFESAGLKFKASRERLRRIGQERAAQLYNEVDELLPDDILIPLGTTRGEATALLQKESLVRQATEALNDTKLTNILSDISGNEALSFPVLRELRQALGAEIKVFQAQSGKGTKFERAITKVINAIDQDLDDFANITGGAVKEKYDIAKGFYGRFKDRFDNKQIQQLIQRDPQSIVDAVFKKNNLETMRRVKRAGGPEAWKSLKSQFTRRVLESNNMNTALRPYDNETLNFIYTKSELNDLRSLGRVVNSKIPGNRGAILQSLSQTPLIGAPMRAFVEKMSDKTFERVWRSPTLRKLFLEGLELPAENLGRITAIVTRLGGLERTAKERRPTIFDALTAGERAAEVQQLEGRSVLLPVMPTRNRVGQILRRIPGGT